MIMKTLFTRPINVLKVAIENPELTYQIVFYNRNPPSKLYMQHNVRNTAVSAAFGIIAALAADIVPQINATRTTLMAGVTFDTCLEILGRTVFTARPPARTIYNSIGVVCTSSDLTLESLYYQVLGRGLPQESI